MLENFTQLKDDHLVETFGMDKGVTPNTYSGKDWLSPTGDTISLRTLKRVYRKHVMQDPSIGWDELCDELCNTLSEIMGDEEFCIWLSQISGGEGK